MRAVPNRDAPKTNLGTEQRPKEKLRYVCVPAEISATAKWRREYFSTKEKADKRSTALKQIRKQKDAYAAKASMRLIRDAVECEELAQIYGFSTMRDAFLAWSKVHEK